MTIDKDKFLPPYDPSGKFTFVTSGEMLYPAACFACGSISDDNNFIDTKINIEWVGAIYFCGSCCINIGQALGCMAPKPSKELLDIAVSQAEEIKLLGERCNKLESALDAVSLDRLERRSVDLNDSVVSSDLESNLDATGSESDEGRTDSEFSEPVKVDGPDDTSNSERKHGLVESLDL